MKTWIVVEGQTDRAVLAVLLDDLRPGAQFEIVAAGGADYARPLARTYLLTRREAVALVVDADTSDARSAAAQRRDLTDYLAWGSGAAPYMVVQFVPEIESIFFAVPGLLEGIMGKPVDQLVLIAGREAPKKVLSLLLPSHTPARLVAEASEAQLLALRQLPVIAELRKFIASAVNAANAAVA